MDLWSVKIYENHTVFMITITQRSPAHCSDNLKTKYSEFHDSAQCASKPMKGLSKVIGVNVYGNIKIYQPAHATGDRLTNAMLPGE